VDAIDFAEFRQCDTTPLGGQNRDVFRAKWHRDRVIDESESEPGSRIFDVVLKRVWPPRSNSPESRTEGALFREVRIRYVTKQSFFFFSADASREQLDLTLRVSARRPPGLSVLQGRLRITPYREGMIAVVVTVITESGKEKITSSSCSNMPGIVWKTTSVRT
jgi:hypothetical protein